MEQSTGTGFFKQNKGLELGFMVVGLALFIALGLRGLQRIGDIRVAAGERNRISTAQAAAEVKTAATPAGVALLPTLFLQESAKNDDNTQKQEGRGKTETDKSRAEPRADSPVNTTPGNTKKQSI